MQSRHSRKKDSQESNEGGAFFMSLKATSSIKVVYLGDLLFTCTQQMHWGIYLPVWSNF